MKEKIYDSPNGLGKYRIYSKENKKSTGALVWIPGHNDTFNYQFITDQFTNYNIFSIDFPNWGKQVTNYQKPYNTEKIEYLYPILDDMVKKISLEKHKNVIWLGHSLGALILVSYLTTKDKNFPCQKIILTSPAFYRELNLFLNLVWLIKDLIILLPEFEIAGNKNKVSQNVRSDQLTGLNQPYRFLLTLPIRTKMALSLYQKQLDIRDGKIKLELPILLIRSSKSVDTILSPTLNFLLEKEEWGDVTLNVEKISQITFNLGSNIEEIIVQNGWHNVLLTPGLDKNIFSEIRRFIGC